MDADKKALLHEAIDNMDEEHLEELYRLVEHLSEQGRPPQKQSLMSKLKAIQIDAPEDFAENLDLYLSGEKRAEPDIR